VSQGNQGCLLRQKVLHGAEIGSKAKYGATTDSEGI
jgi:hypothetical protein